ncbi:MAG TPA: malonyl-CoA synthase [Burkholderiaceae bacterium]|nr:malonyl-CoA synthase [Burkholderiaceae bacterium]
MPRTAKASTPTSTNANLYSVLAAGFPSDASACAIEAIDAQGNSLYYTWSDIDRASARLANLLASLGLSAGARIAVQVEKSPEALLLYLATLRAGFVYLPLNTAYQAGELDYFIGNASPGVIVCSPSALDWIKPIARQHKVRHVFTLGEDRTGTLLAAAAGHADAFAPVRRRDDDLAAILYTSGTTGRSKGAMLSHGNLSSNARTLHQYWRWRRGDVLLHSLPIFHVHGLFVASHGALLSGSKMIWMNRFDAATVVRHLPRATVFMGVPTMYVRLLDRADFDARSAANMRLFISGSAPLLTDTFKQFEARIGQRILERYGMSETAMLTSNSYDGNRVAGTVGLPLPGVSVRVVNEAGQACGAGEIGGIEVKGPNVFAGYWQMPEKTREEFTDDGWFRTGDVGRWDANGYLSIVGRSKDLIISGGFNVYPKEIESYLDDMPGVLESAVIGVAHRDFGEAVTAVVVPEPGATLDEAEMIAGLKRRIASFKVPKRIHIVAELPRNQMGKVQKNLLREQFGG